jgi:hypothetical protein
MLRKLFWRYERGRSYAVAGQHHLLPAPGAIGSRVALAVLTVPKSFDDALWSLWSWLRVLDGAALPVIYVDGPVTDAMRAAAAKLFPSVAVTQLSVYLASARFGPALTRFMAAHPLGKKLAMVLAMSRTGPVLYSDSDVIAFNRPGELLEAIDRGQACYLQEESTGVYDQRVLEAARALGHPAVANLNSGLMHVPQGRFNADLAEAVLARLADAPAAAQSWFSEQTLFAVLMATIPALALPQATYVVSNRRQFVGEADFDYRRIAVRHFTGTVRHVMYLKGLPFLLSRARRA